MLSTPCAPLQPPVPNHVCDAKYIEFTAPNFDWSAIINDSALNVYQALNIPGAFEKRQYRQHHMTLQAIRQPQALRIDLFLV